VAPIICSFVGLIFFHVPAFSCVTFHYDSPHPVGVGYWGFEEPVTYYPYTYSTDEYTCKSYAKEADLDSLVKFGRAIAIIGTFIGWVIVITLLFASCIRFPGRKIFCGVMGAFMFLMAVLVLLLLVGVQSDAEYELEVNTAGYMVIPSAVFWIAAAFTTLFTMEERALRNPATAPVVVHVAPSAPVVADAEVVGFDKY